MNSKWIPGRHYGPVLTGIELYTLQAAQGIKCLQLNPILTQTNDAFHLVFNLSLNQDLGGYTQAEPNKDIPFTPHEDEPATFPRVAEMYIITKYSPWVTHVENPGGITLKDVCVALWQTYNGKTGKAPDVTDTEFSWLPVRVQDKFKREHEANVARAAAEERERAYTGHNTHWAAQYSPGGRSPGPRPVDAKVVIKRPTYLNGRLWFDGLDFNEDYAMSRLGYKAPNIFTLSLITEL